MKNNKNKYKKNCFARIHFHHCNKFKKKNNTKVCQKIISTKTKYCILNQKFNLYSFTNLVVLFI